MAKKIADSAAPKTKKPIFKKWWFWAIIVVVVIAVAASGGSKDQPAQDASESAAPTASEETAAPADDAADIKLAHGDLISVTNGAEGVVVVKAKISPSLTNQLTVDQNYMNVADLILNQGFDQYDEIQYWAVADMTSGDEQKVISFTLNKTTIDGMAAGNIVDIELGDYAEDLFIHQSLQ